MKNTIPVVLRVMMIIYECCHWSTARQEQPNQIVPDNDLPELGTCCVNFESETKAYEIIEQIIDQHFLDLCIEATNAHGENDPNHLSSVGILTQDKKGRAFIKGFFFHQMAFIFGQISR